MPHNLGLCSQSARTEICLTATELYDMLLHNEDGQFPYNLLRSEILVQVKSMGNLQQRYNN